jgi:hypothetical protein
VSRNPWKGKKKTNKEKRNGIDDEKEVVPA